jgi:hypothetical protein
MKKWFINLIHDETVEAHSKYLWQAYAAFGRE